MPGAPPSRRAFTLIELVGVLALMAMLSTAAVLGLRGAEKMVRIRDVADHLAFADHLVREEAQHSGHPLQLVINPESGRVFRRETVSQMTASRDSGLDLLYALPANYAIDRLIVAGTDMARQETMIPCSSAGLTPSYAIAVVGPGDKEVWLLVAGMTGLQTEVKDEAQARATLAAISGKQ